MVPTDEARTATSTHTASAMDVAGGDATDQTLAAVEARYALLLQELAQLFQLRERLRRAGDAALQLSGVDTAAPTLAAPPQAATGVEPAPAPARPHLRLLRGGRAHAAHVAHTTDATHDSAFTTALAGTGAPTTPRPALTLIAGRARATSTRSAS